MRFVSAHAAVRWTRWSPRLVPQLGGVAAGIVAALALPPVDVSFLVILGVAGGVWSASRTRSPLVAAASGLLFGLGYFGTALIWSATFGAGVWLVLVVSQAIFWVPVGWMSWRSRLLSPSRRIMAVASSAVLAEAVRVRVPLGGLEWAQLGVSAHDLPLRDAAGLVGALGLTGLVVAAGMALALVFDRSGGRGRWRPLAATTVVAAVVTLVGGVPWTRSTGTLDVAIVQADAPCPGRAAVDCVGERELLLAQLSSATAELRSRPDLVVWGEGVLSATTPEAAGLELGQLSPPLPSPLLVGVTSPTSDGRFFNRNILFGSDGEVLASYAKRHPVPFGEYVPARRYLGGIAEVGRLVPNDLLAGATPGRLALDDMVLGTVSSWEVSFSRLVRDVGIQPQAVFVLTTQATYGRAAVSDQLLRAAQLRAAELQRSVVVAATTGRSVVVEADGTLGTPTRLYASDALEDTVALRSGATPFARFGDVPILIGALAGLLVLQRKRRDVEVETSEPSFAPPLDRPYAGSR